MKKSSGRSKKSERPVRKGLAPQYQRDFDRKESAHAPEVVRRIIISVANSSVAASGVAPFSQANAGGVVNTAEFQAFAQNLVYRQFRVVAIRARIVANFQSPISPTFQSLGPLIGAVSGVAAPLNSVTAILSSQGFRVGHGPLPYIELVADAGLNPNALLWSSIDASGSATLTPANELSLAWRFTRPADPLYNAKTVTDEFYEYDVEFRTAG
jgi:hypothetical protein